MREHWETDRVIYQKSFKLSREDYQKWHQAQRKTHHELLLIQYRRQQYLTNAYISETVFEEARQKTPIYSLTCQVGARSRLIRSIFSPSSPLPSHRSGPRAAAGSTFESAHSFFSSSPLLLFSSSPHLLFFSSCLLFFSSLLSCSSSLLLFSPSRLLLFPSSSLFSSSLLLLLSISPLLLFFSCSLLLFFSSSEKQWQNGWNIKTIVEKPWNN